MDITMQNALVQFLGVYAETVKNNLPVVFQVAGTLLALRFGIGFALSMFRRVTHSTWSP